MKRTFALILAVLMMATVFVGCNKTTEEGGAAAAALEPDAGLKIEVVAQDEGDAATNLLNDRLTMLMKKSFNYLQRCKYW